MSEPATPSPPPPTKIQDLMKTTPSHASFNNMNQAPHCWQRYNEWVICLKTTEGDEEKCQGMRGLARGICPDEWVEKWDEERPIGTFMGVQYPEIPRPWIKKHGDGH